MTAKTESAGRERTATRRPDRGSPQAGTVEQLAHADPVAQEGEDARAALPSTRSAQQADPIVLGILQLVVAVMALAGDRLARWLGVALLVLNVIDQQFFIGTYPLWSALIILFDVLAVYALCRYGSRKNLAALDFPVGGFRA